jgi:hypothetical protein
MKLATTILILFLSLNCNAQIMLKGYKCLFEEGQWPYKMAKMYSKNDTFLFRLLSRDIWAEEAGENVSSAIDLKIGLRLCFFNKEHYFKTKDSLYIATGRNPPNAYPPNTYFYIVYIPEQTVALSLFSNINDADFSDKSKWLLSQIRLHRRNDIYLVNDKHQSCQDPNNPKD